jgi:hypothetical protein
MWTVRPLASLLALALASCSSSANPLTGPDDSLSIDPGLKAPGTSCAPPGNHHGLAGKSSSLSVSSSACTSFSSSP